MGAQAGKFTINAMLRTERLQAWRYKFYDGINIKPNRSLDR